MSTSDRSAALARRKLRIIEHAKAGLSTGEICDLEGLDPANEPHRMRREVLDPAGVTLSKVPNAKPPVGFLDISPTFRSHLETLLRNLTQKHHYIEVSRMTGMTNIQQTRALERKHNWTIAQMQRVGAAQGMSFEDVLRFMMQPPPIDMRNMKI